MSAGLFEVDPSEPLASRITASETPVGFSNARCQRFEFSCRGDRVPGRLLTPAVGVGPFPLILFQHGLGGAKESAYLDAAAPWVKSGAAIASIDFPLHGERYSAKLSERFIASVPRGGALEPLEELLWTEFARQAVMDLRRCLDTLAALTIVDSSRVAYAGFSLGAIVGSVFCAADPRPRAAALALVGGGLGPEAVDPCSSVAQIAPRPLLFLGANADEVIPRHATEALYEQARQPKSIHWYDSSHASLPGVALKTMWHFLRDHLELR